MLQLDKVMIFDGGFGSEIEKRGLDTNLCMEYNILKPEVIQEIHNEYRYADFITTNTFGLNKIKYHGEYDIKDLALAAINNAKTVGKKVMFDIGPTGSMLKPLGTLSFDEAYEAFKEVVLISKDYVDGYILETFSDLYELKAAILAVKENAPDRLLFSTMTFDKTERTLTGSTPEIMVNTLEGLGVDALGVNCGLGPKELYNVITRILKSAHVPVIIQPNRGLPKLKDGKTYYDLTIEEYDEYIKKYVELGVSIVGGCCGTNPDFIKEISKYNRCIIKKLNNPYKTIINSATVATEIENVVICGERMNPTGKKKLKQKLIDGDYDYLVGEALKQVDCGAKILDLNVGVPKLDEVKVLKEALIKVQEYVDTPIQIDTSNKDAMEIACRYYNGIPLINSVNGEKAVMDRVFPIAKKYGAVVLGLALDENGVPKTAEERLEIAKRIINEAAKYGIPKEKIMIDTLVLTASAEQALVKETLRGLTLVRQLGVKTALGVSNVSFGLPRRILLNKTFLTMAMYAGLNMPIINPLDSDMTEAIDAYNVLLNIDNNSVTYIEKYNDTEDMAAPKKALELDLKTAVMKGLNNECEALTNKELETHEPLYVVNEILIQALKEVGELYDKGKMYLPQLIAAAEAAKVAFAVISKKFPKSSNSKGTIVMATVKGDVHDIGKNICKVVLESYGYDVIDLGKDTAIDVIIDAYKKYHPMAIGLSALMTTTVISMEDTIKALREINCDAKIIVGGAVLTQEIANSIGADFYSVDALDLARIIEKINKEK